MRDERVLVAPTSVVVPISRCASRDLRQRRFCCLFSNSSLLALCRPDLLHVSNFSGEEITGDAIKMVEAIGVKASFERVQMNRTGLVRPDDPDAKFKFLAAEAFRELVVLSLTHTDRPGLLHLP